jgi:uncharacterized protein (UPF0332 family)
MSDYIGDYIQYRIEKSNQAYDDALLLAQSGSWNGSINRLYYTCYYLVSALTLKDGIETKTHSGLRNQLNLHYVKNGKIPIEMGRLYSDLFDSRQKGDYGDMYDFDKETVESLLIPVKEFIDTLKQLL